MKYLNFLFLALIGLFSACSAKDELIKQYNNGSQTLQIEVLDSHSSTRVAYSGLDAAFESGDVIGLYAVDEDGTTQFSNVAFTYNGSSWTAASNVTFDPDWLYYAYYPYVASPYSPDFSQSTVDTKFSTFIADVSDKFHLADQSTKANFNSSDLMIAQGSVSGTNTVRFAMDHKKALAYFTGDVSSKTFTGNIPYITNNIGYFCMKPNTSTTIGNYSLAAASGKYINQEVQKPAYLTFKAIDDCTFTFSKNAINYSTDGGATWTSLAAATASPIVSAGDSIIWKANLTPASYSGIGTFSSTGQFDAKGNPLSLIYGSDFEDVTDVSNKYYLFYNLFYNNIYLKSAGKLLLPAVKLGQYCYSDMFRGCTGLTTAPELPATTLAISCYYQMFCQCTGLTTAPELPATTLANDCYYQMFCQCTGLTTAPDLPATTLAQACYSSMFQRCTGLTTAPELPATTLAYRCYSNMFQECTGLTTAPELPATTLTGNCYDYMFYWCTGLTTAPELPATTLAAYCYRHMFNGCTGLTTAPELPATTLATSCYMNMFQRCTGLTTAPELPATTLSDDCYNAMFSQCIGLTTAPELPATTLAIRCYCNMFQGCTRLTTAPELPVTTLAYGCYHGMFSSCTRLTAAPDLPATILTEQCYRDMFYGCSSLATSPELPATTLTNWCYANMFTSCGSLTAAPDLPATTLVANCYKEMFKGCSNLNYIKAMFTTEPGSSYTSNWLNSVKSGGTFVKNSAATWDVTGSDGIPSSWSVQTASE